jgi:hypothetical protein
MEISMDVDGSDFDEPIPKKKATTRGKKAVQLTDSDDSEEAPPKKSTARGKKATAEPAKKAPAKGRGKKAAVSQVSYILKALRLRLL